MPPRCCCWRRSTPSGARGRRSCARRASCASARCCAPAIGPVVEIGGRTEAGDTFTVTRARRRRAAGHPGRATAGCRCRRTSPPRWPRPTATRRCTPPSPARPPRRPPACTSRPELLDRCRGQGVELARVELLVGLDTFQPVSVDDPAPARDPQRALPGAAPRCSSVPRRRGGWSPSAPRACAPSNRRRPPGSSPVAPGCSSTARTTGASSIVLMTNFHLPRTTLLLMIDAFVGERWRRLYAEALRERLPLPQLRRRDAPRPAGRLMHPVRFEPLATDGAARTGVAHTARGSYRTPCFMPVGTRGAVKYLSAADYDRPRRRDRARQHVPPDAAPGRRRGRPLRRPRPVRRRGTG